MVNPLAENTKGREFIELEIRVKSLVRLLTALAVGSLFFLAATGIVYRLLADVQNLSSVLARPAVILILSQFNLTSENTLATWYSSMVMLSAGMGALLCYLARNAAHKNRGAKWGWLLLTVFFIFLSLDEVGSIYEPVRRIIFFNVFGTTIGQSGLFVLSLIGALFLAVFAFRELKWDSMAFWLMGIGTLLILSIPIQRYFETQMWSRDEEAWTRPILWALAEEGCLLFASLLFISGMVVHLLARRKSVRTAVIQYKFSPAVFKRVLTILLIAMSCAFLLLYASGKRLSTDDGIALNWFPAALAFILLTILLLFRAGRMPWILVYLMLLSGYYGSNFYALIHWPDIAILSYVVRMAMLLGLVYFTFTLSLLSRDTSWRITHLFGGLLIGSGFVFDHPLVTLPVAIGLIIILSRHFRKLLDF